jgi:ribosome-associated toxin RatA of RatAB toxin-antitoxin module
MQLVEGPFRHFAAHWRFHALGARAARIEFALEYDFSSRVVAAALAPVFDAIADTMVDAFKRRADQVDGTSAH